MTTEIAPGAFLLSRWLSEDRQVQFMTECLKWLAGPIPAVRPNLAFGRQMSVEMTCLGKYWVPYRYVDQVDGTPVPPLADWLVKTSKAAVEQTFGDIEYEPDAALVNSYSTTAAMGMHQDKDERVSAPVVSFSLGNSCLFRFGNSETRNKPWTDLVLESGDVFVFGGKSRFCYHGVVRTHPQTSPDFFGSGFDARINVTVRQTGI